MIYRDDNDDNSSRSRRNSEVSRMVSEYETQQQQTPKAKTLSMPVNDDMMLEIYAETGKGREMARWINQNKQYLTTYYLDKINNILYDQKDDHTFLQDFAAGQGLTYLCSLSILRENEGEILIGILDIFQCIMNTLDCDNHDFIGYNLILHHTHAIQAIADMFESKDKTVKCKVIKLLTIMCLKDDAGFEAVLKALYTYGERHNASSVFDEFVRSMYFEQDLEFRRDALKFVNAVLNLSPDLTRRVNSRHMLTELGFDNVIDQLWDEIHSQQQKDREQEGEEQEEEDENEQDDTDENIDEEIKDEEEEVDQENENGVNGADKDNKSKLKKKKSADQLLEDVAASKKNKQKMRYDENIRLKNPLLEEIKQQLLLYRKMQQEDDSKLFWGKVNLNDPQEITKHLFKQAMQQKHLSEFMHTLIAMCAIPDNAFSDIYINMFYMLYLNLKNICCYFVFDKICVMGSFTRFDIGCNWKENEENEVFC